MLGTDYILSAIYSIIIYLLFGFSKMTKHNTLSARFFTLPIIYVLRMGIVGIPSVCLIFRSPTNEA